MGTSDTPTDDFYVTDEEAAAEVAAHPEIDFDSRALTSLGTSQAQAATQTPAPAALRIIGGGALDFNRQQIELIKQTIAVGASDLELDFFLEVCRLTGLNPFQRQIYAIMRTVNEKDARTGAWRSVRHMTIQTGIDGYRLIAARTGQLAGIDDATFDTEDADHPGKATVTVWRFVAGQRVPFTATARWREYAQHDKTGNAIGLWAPDKMPYGQLAKCAEALALRKGFPAELSGVYTREEMAQAENEPIQAPTPQTAHSAPHRATVREEPAARAPVVDLAIEDGTPGSMSITGFCQAVKARLNLTPKQAMEKLDVKSLADLDLNAAFVQLTQMMRAAGDDDGEEQPYDVLADAAWHVRADRMGFGAVEAKEHLLAKYGYDRATVTREEAEAALHAEEQLAAAAGLREGKSGAAKGAAR